MVYDWEQGGDTQVVVEDLENLKYDGYKDQDTKLKDWRFFQLIHKLHLKHFSYDRDQMLYNMDIDVPTDVPELLATGNEWEHWENLWLSVS